MTFFPFRSKIGNDLPDDPVIKTDGKHQQHNIRKESFVWQES